MIEGLRTPACVVALGLTLALTAARDARATPGAPVLDVATKRAGAVRFVALGDGGYGGARARVVVDAARDACAQACDFVVLLGDNVYPRGIDAKDDPRWQERVTDVLAPLGLPVFAVPGNHDWGAPRELPFLGGLGVDVRRARAMLAAAQGAGAAPAFVSVVRAGPAELVLFDTQSAYLADLPPLAAALGADDVARDVDRQLAMRELMSTARFRIALAHHPYRSNGVHGDAGRFDGLPAGGPFSGASVQHLLERHVIGRYALYLSGHDHDVMDLGNVAGTALVVSGGASDTRPLASDREAPFAAASLGFVLVDVTSDALAFEVWTVDEPDAPGRAAGHATARRAHVRRVDARAAGVGP